MRKIYEAYILLANTIEETRETLFSVIFRQIKHNLTVTISHLCYTVTF